MYTDRPSVNDEVIILFTRFPRPGKVKTRLIKHLGSQGAAELHKTMTEQTIRQVQPLLRRDNIQLHVYFHGGTRPKMAQWLGTETLLFQQQGSDLGQRMLQACSTTLEQGARRILLIGSDCPGLQTDTLQRGLQELDNHDLVLGPTADGGYYLIGLHSGIPAQEINRLFHDIDWGTTKVLRQTLHNAAQHGLSHTLLPQLHDIDRAEDLVYLNHHTCS